MKSVLAASTSAAALLLLSTAAMADVTAEEVSQNWQGMAKASGQTFTIGKEEKGDGTVTLTDVGIATRTANLEVSGKIPSIVFTEAGDGTVSVTMSPAYDLAFASAAPDRKRTTGTIGIKQDGMTLIVSGTPQAMDYAWDVASGEVAFGNFEEDGVPKDLDIDVKLKEAKSTYNVKPGERRDFTSTFAVSSVDFSVSGTDTSVAMEPGTTDGGATGAAPAGEPMKYAATGTVSGLAGASTVAMDGKSASGDLAQMLANGFATRSSFTYDSSAVQGSMDLPGGGKGSYSTTSGAGRIAVAVDPDHLSYDIGTADNAIELKMAETGPMSDASFSIGESRVSILVPVAKSDTPKPFGFNMTLRGVTLSDAIWSLFDPQSTIPRDPITVVLDTKGTATPKQSLANPGGMDAFPASNEPPADLDTLEITDLDVSGGGAELKGSGALAFDNTRPKVLAEALPMPTGTIDLTLDGSNDLMGKLMALGILPPQAMMGFGMVTALIAKPGPTADSLVSKIEFTDDGKILANGNPLPIGQ